MKLPNEKADKKFSFTNRFLTGLIIALALSLTAFEWTTITTEPYVFGPGPERGIEVIEELKPFTIEKLEKPKPKVEPTKSDEFIIKDDIPEPDPKPEPTPDPPVDPNPPTEPFNWDVYGKDTVAEEEIIYVSVQIFAHYDECKGLEGEELAQCGQLRIMDKVKENFEISQQLKFAGGVQSAYLRFIVDERGDITDIEVLRATCKAMEKDARKALQKLPRMNPAIQQGEKVKLRMTIPIKVTL